MIPMINQSQRTHIGLLILAGVGAGTLSGALVGLLLTRRARGQARDEMTETVDDLRRRAEQILGELSQNAVGREASEKENVL